MSLLFLPNHKEEHAQESSKSLLQPDLNSDLLTFFRIQFHLHRVFEKYDNKIRYILKERLEQ